jgi:hypothetical protein
MEQIIEKNDTLKETLTEIKEDELVNELNNLQLEEIKTFYLEDLYKLINKNEYIKNCKSNKKKDFNSLSYLIDKNLSQSDCIKLGIGMEKFLVDVILQYSHDLKSIKEKNMKGIKEKDHLFIDEKNKIIYYSELKSNINLDTEKSKTTSNKCLEIVKQLEETYKNYQIKWCLLGLRYLDYNEIPKVIQGKYTNIKENLYGINQYLNMLSISISFTKEEYKKLLNKISDAMFD